MTNKLGSANPNRIPNWNKRMDFELDKLLAKNNLTRKDVKVHNAEYYPTGQVKMKILYLGTWGKRKCYECSWLDYDEQGNQMIFNTKEDRLDWIRGMDIKYRQEMDEEELEENEGIVFPESMPSKKTGKKYFKKYHWDLMDDLECYWNDKKFPIDPITKQPYYVKSYFEHLADKYDVHFKTIEKFASDNSPEKTIERNRKTNKKEQP